jgi:hypothetical protein
MLLSSRRGELFAAIKPTDEGLKLCARGIIAWQGLAGAPNAADDLELLMQC